MEHDLPRELAADPDLIDEVAVRLACAGELVELTAPERVAAACVLYGRGLTRPEIAVRLGIVYRDVPEPTQPAVCVLDAAGEAA